MRAKKIFVPFLEHGPPELNDRMEILAQSEAETNVVVASRPPLSLYPLPSSSISTSPASKNVSGVAPTAMDERNCSPGGSSEMTIAQDH